MIPANDYKLNNKHAPKTEHSTKNDIGFANLIIKPVLALIVIGTLSMTGNTDSTDKSDDTHTQPQQTEVQ